MKTYIPNNRNFAFMAIMISAISILCGSFVQAAAIYITNNTNSTTAGSVVGYTYNGVTVSAGITGFTTIAGLNGPYAITSDGTNLYTGSLQGTGTGSTINKYTLAGANVSVPLISAPGPTRGLATYNGFLYQAGTTSSVITKYSTSSGSGTSFITGLTPNIAHNIAIDAANNIVYVSSYDSQLNGGGQVGSYNLTTGAVITANLISGVGLGGAFGLALDGAGDLFISGANTNVVSKYVIATNDLTTGFINIGSGGVQGIAIDGTDLYVVQNTAGKIGKYSTINASGTSSFISGLTAPEAIVVIPEPSSVALICIGGAAFVVWTTRRRFRKIA